MKTLSIFAIVTSLWLCNPACADDPPVANTVQDNPEGIAYFEQHVRPILVEHCFECHNSQQAQKGGLILDTRAGLMAGGDNGPACVPGDAQQSLLVQAVKHVGDLAMPPDEKLSDEQIARLEKWVSLGAPYPQAAQPVSGIMQRVAQAKQHWAFQPLSSAPPPEVTNSQWVRQDVDRFILHKLESLGWQPAPQADRVTLIRRVTLDLLGLLPTVDEVQEFVADESPNAYEKVVDRLLASPHYGERWGRHWLDLARYADSSGFHNDLDRPYAWKYRDYVIDSFNEDKPYAQFVAEQLAGDEVPHADQRTIIATGFARNGPSNDDNMGKTELALKQYRADQLDDVISTTSTVFMGVTIGCARCHDHKTDPFTTQDYYRLLAIFNGTEEFGIAPGSKETKAKVKDGGQVDTTRQIQARIEKSSKVPATYVMRRGNVSNLGEEVGPGIPPVLVSQIPVSENLVPESLVSESLVSEKLADQLSTDKQLIDQALVFPTVGAEDKTSRRRITLAGWIASPDNALTWRVLANRIWQHHFGRGIVATPSNFGFSGARPTHPELLDYLASVLIKSQGSWKPLHKMLVMSATYQQASQAAADVSVLRDQDPDNQWLSHMNLRRMEAEVIRDSILMASGQLNRQFAGPGVKPRLPPELIPASQRNKWPAIDQEKPEHWRRSVYIYAKRQLLMPMLELFDAPTTTDSCSVRTESVVPTQALVLMNDQFVETQAGYLAERALRASDQQPTLAIERMFEITLGHAPSPDQRQQAEQFLQQRAGASDLVSGLTDLAHVIFNSSQFIHIP